MPEPEAPSAALTLDSLAERALALVPAGGGRAVLGIAGSPGAGKSTLAAALARHVNDLQGAAAFAAPLPMDGYHLAESTLRGLGRLDRKGAIDTFDGWGFVSLLSRLREETGHTVYAPSFDRRVEEPIAGEHAVEPETRLVIVEGNYLLADVEPWSRVKGLLDEAWFCETPVSERERRLVARHELGGRSHEAAVDWAHNVDGRNALLIEATAARADLVISGQLPALS
ncbi:nucleoside/nucleotide kinase family protein [Cnuibacter physcomitrellae]|uniref:Nucleoside/nucleotide kinase family protein n=1 Tax=Cnuibacter physcomitrellae TaxID=1619308 RepID=A0A1X9LNY7_9MICO|nr:nucleoside/nucleotide kinase family protein [Cnuibacter physcomitrellae]ARJ06906.1 nucleoside/nucleotide kinase family protein [Cnuibacter physcomitrellae]GGI39100.1 nucleoside/nucleotide kinase family protein [Cnuibacter physcomitrellae]